MKVNLVFCRRHSGLEDGEVNAGRPIRNFLQLSKKLQKHLTDVIRDKVSELLK